KYFLTYQIEQLLEIGFELITVVLGKDNELYQEKVPELKATNIVVNPDPDRGPFSSIQCGLTAVLKTNQEGVFILPVDVPCPHKDVWKKLSDDLSSSEASVSVPEFLGKRGHPVLLSEEFGKFILTCNSDSRLDFEIHKQRDKQEVTNTIVDDMSVTYNLNTRNSWDEYRVKK
ncbi:MAG: nucleotidyltransferase family protein, partial [Candidatus Heimdallarchaeota archaeon]|nr:nucleotidyltransferase family protein [Candidatus Heimdallarchaeota archaeon]